MNNFTVSIMPATTADMLPLRQLSIVTFTDTYAAYNTPENMQLYIDTYFNTERLLSELSDSNTQFFLAYINDGLAGYVKLRTTEELVELAGVRHIEIERIYVLNAFKGMKIGKKLVGHAVDVAKEQQYQVLWLGVWDQNTNALAFYLNQGFIIFGEHAFVLGTDPQRDWLMKKML